jgi:hypothetical protein
VAITRAEERLIWVTRYMLSKPQAPLGIDDLRCPRRAAGTGCEEETHENRHRHRGQRRDRTRRGRADAGYEGWHVGLIARRADPLHELADPYGRHGPWPCRST